MSPLRILLGTYGVACLAGAAYLLWRGVSGWTSLAVAYLVFNGALIMMAAVLRSRRYKAKAGADGPWQPTGEKFVDDTSGQLVEVYVNPTTGDRKYEPIRR